MIWKEIRNDFLEVENEILTVFIDACTTDSDEEEGTVIAKVYNDADGNIIIEYLDSVATEDPYAQEIVKDSIKKVKEYLKEKA